MRTINLLPAIVRERAAVRRRVRAWTVFGAIYIAALAGVGTTLRMMGSQENNKLASDGGRLTERVMQAEKELSKIRQQVQEHARALEASETVGVHPDWSILLAAIGRLREQEIVLQSVDIRAVEARPAAKAKSENKDEQDGKPKSRTRMMESYVVALKGYGLSHGEVVKFVRRLEDLGPLRDVQLKEAKSQPYQGVAAVAFDAEFRLLERPLAESAGEVAGAEGHP